MIKISSAFRKTLLATLCLATTGLASGTVLAEEMRVVGSWSNLTMYKNFEQPFWAETAKEIGIDASVTSLSQVKLDGPAPLRQMKLGVFDVVHTVVDYVVSDSPVLAGLDLPALATDIDQARQVVTAFRPILEEYLEKDFDAKLLSVVPYPAQVIFSRVKLDSLADLKGKKIRASGWTTSEFVTALGASGVTLPFSEVSQALQRDVVSGAITGSLSGYSAGWGEVADYVYPLPVGGWDYVIGVISMKRWNELGKEKQEQLQNLITTRMEEPAWQVTAEETQAGLDCLSGKECSHGKPGKVEILPISEGDRDLAKEILVKNVLPAWSAKVDPSVVARWNESVGKITGITAAK